MHCKHCGVASTSRGTDISAENFTLAVKLAVELGDSIFLGGGEPTVHPLFDQLLLEALYSKVEYVGMITNGKLAEKALQLLEMSKRTHSENFTVELSQDAWHQPIQDKVVEEYRRIGRIRTVTPERIINSGRAKEWGYQDYCICPDIFVKPSGVIKKCGCKESITIGNVKTGIDPIYLETYNECYKDHLERYGELCSKRKSMKKITQRKEPLI